MRPQKTKRTKPAIHRFMNLNAVRKVITTMKKLTESEKLGRGVQILLSSRDKADLEKMAQASGNSVAAATRPHIIRALERWRKANPELVTTPLPQKPSLILNGKTVRSQRSLEAQMRGSSALSSNGGANGRSHTSKSSSLQRARRATKE